MPNMMKPAAGKTSRSRRRTSRRRKLLENGMDNELQAKQLDFVIKISLIVPV
jgi:hypothetical protein